MSNDIPTFDATTNSCHLGIDLAQDFTVTTFDPEKIYYAMPNQIPESAIRNITSFSICELYFLKYTTEGSRTWHNLLRRMIVFFSKHPRDNSAGAEWRMDSPI
ncbi:hypothetical protein AC578_6503 [Pseudocercospora eumusae]|uniref:Uncharacterized protein n=1 Tax=Pseudocercospora eumusae TaxID=321146 RepID=A0A139HI13_9PEZI|nr:hypothetical protein AC578_6503 [Pseudocercospora eumusae]